MATGAVQASNRTIARAAANAADRFADRLAVRYKRGDHKERDNKNEGSTMLTDKLQLSSQACLLPK